MTPICHILSFLMSGFSRFYKFETSSEKFKIISNFVVFVSKIFGQCIIKPYAILSLFSGLWCSTAGTCMIMMYVMYTTCLNNLKSYIISIL